ncbi:MAG: cobalt ECF transporter T component CbiQ [Omnitrophica WOR_2 bacterium GWF2_43_52]|nr:MAG: cobalt ECF transporter T component CbiQ [Omnitrophica WOR_2 bacterium GWC2_44_8]OGX22386.1 MAG: cobalt ECF transporter T component CbiQ [Omnitrophica WOR_2 bacterium GWF2_43_52]HAH20802.1 cobalt ECF transporter T component CbiQ [Candidatus Omnitrophota bacterium]HBG64470.1 cobalt ECF transporter T component CbiQ [Candidatus Omnitrophota bacterium]HCD39153.1 cobalt ECF transporter T component CbiQ [Candidatus Omnitrophota bacterium]
MIKEIFSDSFAQKENYLTNIDARIKLIFVIATMVLCLLSAKSFLPLGIAVAAICFLGTIKVPFRVMLVRFSAPLGIALTVVLLQIFLFGKSPIIKVHLFGYTLVGYMEGLQRGLLILSRVTATVSLVIFLSMTTPLNKLLAAAGYFKVPATWIEITMLAYRYIFMLFEDVSIVRDAQKMRLGYSNVARSLRSIGELAGAAVIKAYDQSLAVQEAMMLRGYKEKVIYSSAAKFTPGDNVAAVIFTAFFLTLLIINFNIR